MDATRITNGLAPMPSSGTPGAGSLDERVARPWVEPAADRERLVGRAILEAATYADIFDWPLTPAEIHRYLPVRAELGEVVAALASPRLDRFARSIDGFVTLSGREDLVPERRRREAVAARLWPRAIRFARVVASLPFVRLVAVTGSLAVGSARAADDVDLFVVTEPGRLWLTRAMTIVVVHAAAVRGIGLCPNYFLAESALMLRDRDAFTAHELLQMVPIAGDEAYRDLLEQNGWYREFLPNHPGSTEPVRPLGRRIITRIAARALRAGALDRLESWERERKIARLTGGARTAEMQFDESVCKGHFGEHRQRTLAIFEERLAWIRAEAP